MSLFDADVFWPGLIALVVAVSVIYNLYCTFDRMFESAVDQMEGVPFREAPGAQAAVVTGFFTVILLFMVCEGGVAYGFNRVVEALRGQPSVLLSMELARTSMVPWFPVVLALATVAYTWGDRSVARRIWPVLGVGLVFTLMAHGLLLTPW